MAQPQAAHPPAREAISLIYAFFSKNLQGQREKRQALSIYQASFYQICAKSQEEGGKEMGN